jgi:dihydroceramidase
MELVSVSPSENNTLVDFWTTSIIYRNPVYHQVLFSMLMLITIIRIRHLLRSDASRRLPEEVKSSIATTFAAGTGLFALGFLIWNLDNIFCTALTRQKVVVGWPVAFLLEGVFHVCARGMQCSYDMAGHAWWHILTVSYYQIRYPRY